MSTPATFSWASLGDVGLGIFGQLAQGYGQYQSAKEAAATVNDIRKSQNIARSAQRGLAVTIRDINNRRIMTDAATKLDALSRTASRTADALARRQFEQSVQAAEEWGVTAARAAMSGLGGSGIEAMGQVAALKAARQEQLLADLGDAQTYELARQKDSIMTNAYLGQDFTVPNVGMDQRKAYNPGITGFLIDGLINGTVLKKDSLKTFLGSLAGNDSAGGVAVAPGNPVAPQRTGPWEVSNLGPLFPTQAEVRRVDNTTMN